MSDTGKPAEGGAVTGGAAAMSQQAANNAVQRLAAIVSTTTGLAVPVTLAGEAPPLQSPRDQAIAAARDLPTLLAGLAVADPELAGRLQPPAVATSKTPAGVALVAAVTWLSGHYGLGWDEGTTTLVAGGALLATGYLAKWVESWPVWAAKRGAANNG